MKVKNCLIFAAGKGTRMGEIGQILPKVLWPVFEKTLLELQISHAKDFGCERIFINTHHLSDQVANHINSLNDESITVLHEEVLLDSGGPIHNVASYMGDIRNEYLLTLNADHFIFLQKKIWEAFKQIAAKKSVTIMGIPVTKDEGYNQIVIHEDSSFGGVVKNLEAPENFYTYAGVSIIKLDSLNLVKGPSRFFESVANYDQYGVGVYCPEIFDEWDFGTIERYTTSILHLLKRYVKNKENESDPMINFCRKNSVIQMDKISTFGNSYGSLIKDVCNFGCAEKVKVTGPAVIIDGEPLKDFGPGVYFKEFFTKY